jgi:pyruvate dehydrogenase E2 component (dihydrolipoamide acetyltransferase)
MAIKILMPALSPTMKEGNLARWLKKEGDKVSAGEVIAEIETDKAIMEVEAVDEGVIAKIMVAAGAKNVKVNGVIAILAEEGESIEDAIKEVGKEDDTSNAPVEAVNDKKVELKTEVAVKQSENTAERIFASPLAKRIASQENIQLDRIAGSGPRGRIVKSDVENHIAHAPALANSHRFGTKGDVVVPITNIRRVIAERLVESKQQVPHFYLEIECMMDRLMEFRTEINSAAETNEEAKPEYKISVNDLLIKAAALSLAKHPKVNSVWRGEDIIQYGSVDISVAVAIEDGLMTPIVRSADQKSLIQISSEVKELAKKAKSQRLKPEEYQGGGFSISNLGMYSIKSFYAIINPPQSSIMAVGATRKVPMYNEKDELEMRHVMSVSLSCDHRVVDGATAAMFLNTFKKFIETPSLMSCY